MFKSKFELSPIMGLFIQISQFLLSLTLLVFLHELGHFLPAKLFGIRVSKFYVFFDFLFPLPKVLNFSLFKKKVGDTEYGIGWFPLGGYVQIDGMVDESMDVEKLKEPAQPWEFRSKPAWQRLIVMIGGVTVNVVLAIIIYIGMLWYWGQEYLPAKNATNGFMVMDSIVYDLGIQNGDKIVSVDKVEVDNFRDITKNIILNQAKTIEVIRNGQAMSLNVPDNFISKLIKSKGRDKNAQLLLPRMPVVVNKTEKNTPAAKANLKEGDRIIAVNGQPTVYYDEFTAMLAGKDSQKITLNILRGKDTIVKSLVTTADAKLGFRPDFTLDKYFTVKTIHYTFLEAVPQGFVLAYNTLDGYVRQLGLLFSGKVNPNESLGGFASMSQLFGEEWEWQAFWSLTALLSVVLAFMNILPIPALDGGHVLFLLYEMIFRKPPPLKFMEYAQMGGMAFLLGLMLYVNGLDLYRFLVEKFQHLF